MSYIWLERYRIIFSEEINFAPIRHFWKKWEPKHRRMFRAKLQETTAHSAPLHLLGPFPSTQAHSFEIRPISAHPIGPKFMTNLGPSQAKCGPLTCQPKITHLYGQLAWSSFPHTQAPSPYCPRDLQLASHQPTSALSKASHFGHHAKTPWHATRGDKKAVFFDERGDHSANKGKREEQISFVVF